MSRLFESYVVLDTETTGFVTSQPWDDPRQPYMLQLAWATVRKGAMDRLHDFYIAVPQGITIPEGAQKVHGISEGFLKKVGQPVKPILELLQSHIEQSGGNVVGHNIAYDISILRIAWARYMKTPFPQIRQFCTMRGTTDICKVLKKNSTTVYAWPKLTVAYNIMVPKGIPLNGHNAISDVLMAYQIYETFCAHPGAEEELQKQLANGG